MTTHEETRILRYLRSHTPARVCDLLKSCLPGAPQEWGNRILANLEWLGYITVYYEPGGDPVALELTSKGMSCSGI